VGGEGQSVLFSFVEWRRSESTWVPIPSSGRSTSLVSLGWKCGVISSSLIWVLVQIYWQSN
jgi:hypothetical protein